MKFYIYDNMDSGAAFKVEAPNLEAAYRKVVENYFKGSHGPYTADTVKEEIEQLKADTVAFSEKELHEIL